MEEKGVGEGEGSDYDNTKVIDGTIIGLIEPSRIDKIEDTNDVCALVLGELKGDHEGCEIACEVSPTDSPHSTTYVPPFPVVPPAPLGAPQRTDLSYLAYEMITPDMRSIDREMRFRESATSTFSKGLILLAEANGIIFNPRHSSSSSSSSTPAAAASSCSSKQSTKQNKQSLVQVEEEDNAFMLLMQPMQAILDGTLLSAVSWQCR